MTVDLASIRERYARLEALADQDATGLKGTAWVSAVERLRAGGVE